jgi:hypothetical protein
VAGATLADGTSAVLKVLVPGVGNDPSHEATVLRLADGDACPTRYQFDAARGALLMERLGRPMYELGLPLSRRLEILCATAARIWRPAPDCAHRCRESPLALRLRRDALGRNSVTHALKRRSTMPSALPAGANRRTARRKPYWSTAMCTS